MDQLLEKFNEYRSIANYRVEYILEDESVITFKLKQTDFPHLIGLHKLIDIPVIRQFNDRGNITVSAKYIISKIKKQDLLTEHTVRNSIYFPDIQTRFDNFSKANLMTVFYSNVIVNFNPSIIGSRLQAKYILFEQKSQSGFHHLCVAEDGSGIKYAESFFCNPTDLYIRNQKIIKIRKLRICDGGGRVYLEDMVL